MVYLVFIHLDQTSHPIEVYTYTDNSPQKTRVVNRINNYRIRGNFRGLPIFAVFRGQYESAKI